MQKQENDVKEQQMREELNKKLAEVDRYDKETAEAEATSSILITLKERTDHQIQEAEELIKKRESAQKTLDLERQTRNELFSEKRELGTRLISLKKDLDTLNRNVVKQEELKKTIETEKADLDKVEATTYAQAKSELEEINKEIDLYKTMVADLERGTEKNSLEKECDESLRRKEHIQREIETLSDELEKKQGKQAAITSELDQYKIELEKLKQLESEELALRQQLADLKASKAKETLQEELGRKLYILRSAAALLKKTSEKEKEIEASTHGASVP